MILKVKYVCDILEKKYDSKSFGNVCFLLCDLEFM